MGELFLKDPGLHIAVKSIGRDLREKRDSSSPASFAKTSPSIMSCGKAVQHI